MTDLSLGLACGASSAKPKGTDPPPENQDLGEKNPAEVIDFVALKEQSSHKELTSETDVCSGRLRIHQKKPPELIEFFPETGEWFHRELKMTDVCSGNLGILQKDFKNCIEPILRDGEDVDKGIPVIARGQGGKLFKMLLKVVGRRPENKVVVLSKGWGNFALSHHLDFGDLVDMRMSRNLEGTGLWLDVALERRTLKAGLSSSPAKRVRLS